MDMANTTALPAPNGEAPGPMQERVRSWWLDVLTGQRATDHPIFGNDIHARVLGSSVEVTGHVDSDQALAQLESEMQALRSVGVEAVDFRVRVRAAPEECGLLEQSILGFFRTLEQAELARRMLAGVTDIHPLDAEIMAENTGAIEAVPPEWRKRVERELRKAPFVLLLALDEVDVFRAKALLEETKSAQILTLPPTPLQNQAQAR
jgi:hypothetical protein